MLTLNRYKFCLPCKTSLASSCMLSCIHTDRTAHLTGACVLNKSNGISDHEPWERYFRKQISQRYFKTDRITYSLTPTPTPIKTKQNWQQKYLFQNLSIKKRTICDLTRGFAPYFFLSSSKIITKSVLPILRNSYFMVFNFYRELTNIYFLGEMARNTSFLSVHV